MARVDYRKMSDEDVVNNMQQPSLVNTVRRLFSSHSGRIEQALAQRRPPGAVGIRRMEFEAAQEIIAAVLGRDQQG